MLGLKYYDVSAGLCSRSIIWANPRRFPNAVHDDVQLFKTNRTACPSSHLYLSTVRSHLVNITPLLLFLRLLRWLSYPRSKLFKSPAKFTSGINITFLYIYCIEANQRTQMKNNKLYNNENIWQNYVIFMKWFHEIIIKQLSLDINTTINEIKDLDFTSSTGYIILYMYYFFFFAGWSNILYPKGACHKFLCSLFLSGLQLCHGSCN